MRIVRFVAVILLGSSLVSLAPVTAQATGYPRYYGHHGGWHQAYPDHYRFYRHWQNHGNDYGHGYQHYHCYPHDRSYYYGPGYYDQGGYYGYSGQSGLDLIIQF
jgi:hypothetical protein